MHKNTHHGGLVRFRMTLVHFEHSVEVLHRFVGLVEVLVQLTPPAQRLDVVGVQLDGARAVL